MGPWLLAFPRLRFLEVVGPAAQTREGAACLAHLAALETLVVGGLLAEPGGLGARGQRAFLPPSLTSLKCSFVAFLPDLSSATRLRALAVDNIDTSVCVYDFDGAGLERASGLTTLVLRHCRGLSFAPPSDAGGAVVPLAALAALKRLSLRDSIWEPVEALPLGTTRLEVLDVSGNAERLSAIPLMPRDCAALRCLTCDLPALAAPGSAALLQRMAALEEVDVLWATTMALTDLQLLSLAQCLLLQDPEQAALRAAPRLALVTLEVRLAEVLGGRADRGGPVDDVAAGAGVAAWQAELPGKSVQTLHTHLGPGRKLFDYDSRPTYEAVDIGCSV